MLFNGLKGALTPVGLSLQLRVESPRSLGSLGAGI